MSPVPRDPFGFPIPPSPAGADDPLLRETISKSDRGDLRREAVLAALSEATSLPGDRRPILWLMGGGSGAGKSSILDAMQRAGTVPMSGVVKIDPDAFKEMIPEFKELVRRGDNRAAAVVHEESAVMAMETFERAVALRTNIVCDTTLSNPAKAAKIIEMARRGNYEIRIIGVTVSPQTAIARVRNRGEQTGRFVPIQALLGTHKNFARNFETYVRLADVVELWKTDCAEGETAKRIAIKRDGNLDILSRSDYAEFGKSAELNENANSPDEI